MSIYINTQGFTYGVKEERQGGEGSEDAEHPAGGGQTQQRRRRRMSMMNRPWGEGEGAPRARASGGSWIPGCLEGAALKVSATDTWNSMENRHTAWNSMTAAQTSVSS